MERAHLYRESSLDRIQSPEQLNDYLRVTNPSVWVLLTAVILLLAGLLVWGSMAYIDSVAYGKAEVRGAGGGACGRGDVRHRGGEPVGDPEHGMGRAGHVRPGRNDPCRRGV